MNLDFLKPGDVIVVRTPDHGFWDRLTSRLIRLGAGIEDKPDMENHVAIVHHTDASGTKWVIEARPGGVGWADIREYDNPYTISNAAQEKADSQRAAICAAAEGMLKVSYDWGAIIHDGLRILHLVSLWADKSWDNGKPPAHVVCSSLASYIYEECGLAYPELKGGVKSIRFTMPADWAEWIIKQGWDPYVSG
jgi:hypothetical protein